MGLGTEKTGEGFYGILHSVQNAVQVTAKATRRVDQHEMYRRQKTEHSALGLSKHRAAPSSPERLWRRLGTYLRTEERHCPDSIGHCDLTGGGKRDTPPRSAAQL